MEWFLVIALLATVFWPERGLYARWTRSKRLQSRQAIEDAITHLHQWRYEQRPASVELLAHTLGMNATDILKLVNRMSQQGLIVIQGDGLRLTPDGHRWAVQVIRAHRLFERYLADETSVPMAEIHARADQLEHTVTKAQLDKMDADMGHPAFDPQGDPIPNEAGILQVVESQSLVDWPVDQPAEIVHVEDEPAEVYAQIAAVGFRPGMVVTVVESSALRLVLETESAEHILAPVVAANISVRQASPKRPVPKGTRLTELEDGAKAHMLSLDSACQGLTRRRFLDLGITPGVRIERVMQSAFHEPTAYRVRGTLIALRREQSDMIWIVKD